MYGWKKSSWTFDFKKIFLLWRKIEDLFFWRAIFWEQEIHPSLITYSIFYSMPKSLVPIDFWLVPSKKILKNKKKPENGLYLLNFDLYLSDTFEGTTSKFNSPKPFPDNKQNRLYPMPIEFNGQKVKKLPILMASTVLKLCVRVSHWFSLLYLIKNHRDDRFSWTKLKMITKNLRIISWKNFEFGVKLQI